MHHLNFVLVRNEEEREALLVQAERDEAAYCLGRAVEAYFADLWAAAHDPARDRADEGTTRNALLRDLTARKEAVEEFMKGRATTLDARRDILAAVAATLDETADRAAVLDYIETLQGG